MTVVRYDDIRLFLCDPRAHVRNSLRMALNDAGLRNKNIWEGGDVDAIADAVADPTHGPDIVICDVTDSTDEACQVFSAIRHNELGTNPFICIIAVAWSPNHRLVSKVINSGADLLVAAPISPTLIMERINSLVHSRKPFIVTSDYIGPDRRLLEDRQTDLEMIDVPNSLREKALGQFNAARMREEIKATRASINDQKIDRQAFQVSYLADMVIQEFEDDPAKVSPDRLAQLKEIAKNLKARAAAAGQKELEELCMPLRRVIETLIESDGEYKKKDMNILSQLSLAVRAAARPNEAHRDVARDISQTIVNARASA